MTDRRTLLTAAAAAWAVPSANARPGRPVSAAGSDEHFNTVRDFFARAQFFEMTDDEKLSAPSFEQMDAGVTFGSDDVTFTDQAGDWLEVKAIEFETWLIDDDTKVSHRSPAELPQPQAPPIFYQLSQALFLKQAQFGKARVRVTTTGKYRVTKEGWSIIATDDLSTVSAPTTYTQAEQELKELTAKTPDQAARLQILRLSELKK